MCHYITATLPQKADINEAREIFLAYKLGFEEIENPSLKEHIEKGDHYVLTTSGMCDCGTLLGSEFREEMARRPSETNRGVAELEELRIKGWSETKILRWMREAELTKQKQDQKADLAHESNLSSAHDWLNFLREVLESKATDRIGLLIHMYEGPITGRIKIKGKKSIPVKLLNEAVLLKMEEDLIYNFISE